MAPRSKGIVVPIAAVDNTARAFESVNAQVAALREKVRQLSAAGGGAGQSLAAGMHGAVPEVAAASAAVRALDGSFSVRSVERFLTSTLKLGPALQAAFPLIGAAAFAGVVVDGAEKLYDMEQKGKHAGQEIQRAFGEMLSKLDTTNDELALANSKLEDQIGLLSKHPTNGLQTALAEARVEADKLNQSLQGDIRTLETLLREHEVGSLEGFVSGVASNKGADKEVSDIAKSVEKASSEELRAYDVAIAAAGQDQAKREAATRAHYERMAEIPAAAARKLRARATDVARQQQVADDNAATLKRDHGINVTPIDLTQPRSTFEDAAETFDRLQRRAQLTGTNVQDTGTKDHLEAGKHAQDAANKAEAEQRKAEALRRAKAEADEKAAAAERTLADAQARALLARQKSGTDTELDQLESAHRALQVSDEDYYRRREALQVRDIANRRAALATEGDDLTAEIVITSAAGEKLTGNDKTDNEAKVVALRAKLVDLDSKDAALTAEAAKNARIRVDAETDLAKKRLAAADQIAAQLEGERGGSVVARQQQSRDQFQQRRASAGSDPAVLANLDTQQGIDQDTIGARGADQDFGAGESGRKIARTGIDDQLRRGQITAQDAQRQKIALDKQEADAMQPLLAAYQKLAADGDLAAIDKVAELQQKIAELKNPVNEVAAEIRSQLDSAFEGFFENLERGRHALRSLGEAIQKDATKDAYQQFIRPAVQSAEGILVPNRSADPKLPDSTGLKAAAGGILGKIPGLGKLAGKGGDGQQFTIKIVNQASTPVAAETASASFDGPGYIVSVVLKDLNEGGALAKAFSIG